MKCAAELTASLALVKHTDQDMEKLAARFRALVPANGARHLGWLINAGWRVYFSDVAGPSPSNSPLSKLKDEDRARVLNELLLKSFECWKAGGQQIGRAVRHSVGAGNCKSAR
jgi:hypothetical protein